MTDVPAASTEPAIPHAVELMWGRDAAGSRGPRRGLSLDQVVDAAIAVGDADGYAAISMARVAKRLGFTTMSLYRYVDSKDTLMDLATDRVFGQPPQLDPQLSWREALKFAAHAHLGVLMAHPWILERPLAAPPIGPNNMAWLETELNALSATRLPEPVKLQMVTNLGLYIISRGSLMRQMLNTGDGNNDDGYPDILGQVLSPDQHPALLRAVKAQAFAALDESWEENDLNWGLERLLDGYERFVAQYS